MERGQQKRPERAAKIEVSIQYAIWTSATWFYSSGIDAWNTFHWTWHVDFVKIDSIHLILFDFDFVKNHFKC